MTASAIPYLTMKADERQELRLPALLKAHIARVAALHGQSTSEYLVEIIATRVTEEMEKTLTWDLSAPEVVALLQVLASPAPDTEAMQVARAKAAKLFGPLPAR